jgi:phage I-like protein
MNSVLLHGPIQARLPDIDEKQPPSQIVWLPAGEHQISAGTSKGGSWTGAVKATEAGARAAQASLLRTIAAGRAAWIDFNHEDGKAAGWIKSFEWDPSRGILANVEWTPGGLEALKGKEFRSFSPTFTLNRETSEVSGLWEGHAAGGLVNAPAFGAAMPALAARLAGAESTASTASGGSPDNPNTMPTDQSNTVLASNGTQPASDATTHAASLTSDAIVASLKNDIDALKARELALRKRAAKSAVDVAVARGAIKKEDTALQARWTALLETDEQNAELLAALPGTEKPAAVIVEVGASAPATAKPNVLETLKAMHAERDPLKRGQIYRGVREFVTKNSSEVLPLLAANTLGTLTSDLVTLRSLDLLKLTFPVLGRITTDFSAEQAKYGQSIKTRIVTVPTVGTYNTSTGYGIANTTTTDVTVAINAHKHVTVSFQANELGGTGRDLFGEQVQAMHYALGKDLVDALYALFVIATYTNATTVATNSITRGTLPIAVAKAMNDRGVPLANRTLLLSSAAFAKLAEDSAIVSLAAFQQPEVITGYTLPMLAGVQPIEAVNLPTTGTMTGFALTPDAAVIATRLPADYTQVLPGASHGSMSVITNPDTGLSVLKADFVDHTLGAAVSRIAWMYGVAAGQVASGQIVKST